MQATKETG